MPDLRDDSYWETAILRAAGRLLMLSALEDRPGHGYDIARRLSELCGEWCDPSPAMIYPALHELEASGLIACDTEVVAGRQRRVCRLTPQGEEALRVGLAAWRRFFPTIASLVGEGESAHVRADASAPGCCPGEER